MRRNPVGFVGVVAFLHNQIRRRFSGAVVVRSFRPSRGANFQSVEKLAEVRVAQFDAVEFLHSSADTPGQVRQSTQAFSPFAIATVSGNLATWLPEDAGLVTSYLWL